MAPITYPLSDADLDRLIAVLDESKRLEGLTARELVFETLGRRSADDLHVIELMSRVMPGWQGEFTEDELEGRNG